MATFQLTVTIEDVSVLEKVKTWLEGTPFYTTIEGDVDIDTELPDDDCKGHVLDVTWTYVKRDWDDEIDDAYYEMAQGLANLSGEIVYDQETGDWFVPACDDCEDENAAND